MNYYVYIRRSNGSTSLFLISVLSFVWIVQKSNNYFKKPCTPICWRINQGEITHRIDSKSQLFGPFRQNSEKHIEWLQKAPPFLKKNLVKIQNILQSVEMWARLQNLNIGNVSPSSAGRVRVFKSMRLHLSHIPVNVICVFYSSRSCKQTNMQWRHKFFKTLRNAMEILYVFFLENLAIRKPCYRKRQCTRCIC